MGRIRTVAISACTLAMMALAAPAAAQQSLQGPPATLSIKMAKKGSKQAVDGRLSLDRKTFRSSCRRRARLRVTCRARWEPAASFRRQRGTITIKRTGTRGSPTDSYRLLKGGRTLRGTLKTATRRANLGSPLTLSADQDETTVRITVGRPVDNLPAREFSEPRPGTRYVGYPVTYVNTGDRPFTTFLANDSRVVLSSGQTLEPSSFGAAAPCDQSDLLVPAGQQRVGCIVFELPFGAVPRLLEMNLDSRNSEETGQWL